MVLSRNQLLYVTSFLNDPKSESRKSSRHVDPHVFVSDFI